MAECHKYKEPLHKELHLICCDGVRYVSGKELLQLIKKIKTELFFLKIYCDYQPLAVVIKNFVLDARVVLDPRDIL